MANSKFLKRILTTASMGALTLSIASEANAVAAAGINLSTLPNAPQVSIADLVQTNADNWAMFNAPGQTLNLTGGTQLVGPYMSNPGTVNVINSTTILTICNNSLGEGPNQATINVYSGQTLTLGGGGG